MSEELLELGNNLYSPLKVSQNSDTKMRESPLKSERKSTTRKSKHKISDNQMLVPISNNNSKPS